MYIQNISFTAAALNAGTDVARRIDVTVSPVDSLILLNATNAQIYIAIFTASEFAAYEADATVSDLIPVANNDSLSINQFPDGQSVIVVRGSGAAHNATLVVSILKGTKIYNMQVVS